jgi:MoxR-like ATPase
MKFDNNHRWVFDVSDIKNPFHLAMLKEEGKVIVGYERELVLLNMLFTASGHAILMANSGLGKTKIANVLPLIIKGCIPARTQGTPDALPSTVIGYPIDTADGGRVMRPGQVPGGEDGANFLLVDEGTRYTPRLWAAFLQMLEEREKTVEDVTQPMADPFVGVITCNFPAPGQGTVDLPDAAYDRLMFNIQWGYPTLEGLKLIIERAQWLRQPKSEQKLITPVTDLDGIRAMREEVYQIASAVGGNVIDYIARLTYATNPHLELIEPLVAPNGKSFKDLVAMGGSPRCAMDLKMASAALAHVFGEDKVRLEHVKAVFPEVARAHTKMNQTASLGKKKVKVDDLIDAVLKGTRP